MEDTTFDTRKTSNRIRPTDEVRVQIIDTDGRTDGTYSARGFNDIDEAVHAAFKDKMPADADIRDYSYVVTNLTDGTAGRYRINAHGNLRLEV